MTTNDKLLVERVAIALAEFDGRYWIDMSSATKTRWIRRAERAIETMQSYKHPLELAGNIEIQNRFPHIGSDHLPGGSCKECNPTKT